MASGRGTRWLVLLGLAALGSVGGCGGGGGGAGTTDRAATSIGAYPTSVAATSSTGTPPAGVTTPPESVPAWIVGANPLPLRPDGLGEMLPTPAVLEERSLPTTSALEPPATDAFESEIAQIDEAIRSRMGGTWADGCPVPLDELRYVTVSFWGFDGGHHTGELVLHAGVVEDVVGVFAELHRERFPIEEMRLIGDADLEASPTGDGNNTASFHCRAVRGSSTWSEHAKGLAVDVNPFQNPYVRGDVIVPELASAYLDRAWERPGMVRPGDVVVAAFAAIGWSWGGEWSSPDYMHFSASGR